MPAEQRRCERIPARLAVRYGLDAADHAGVAENISEGGMYINTNRPFKVGARLILHVQFPDRVIVHRGEVVWAIQAPEHLSRQLVCGMGLKFLDPAAEWSRLFHRWRSTFCGAHAGSAPD